MLYKDIEKMYYIFENILNSNEYKKYFDYKNQNNNIDLISNDIKYTEEKLITKLNNFINIIKTSDDVNYLYVDSNLLDFEDLKNKMYETISENFEKYTKYDNIYIISHNNTNLNLYKIEINKLIRLTSVVYYNFELNFTKITEYNILKCNNVYINNNLNYNLNNNINTNNINTNNINNLSIVNTYDNITKKNYNINYDKNLKDKLLTELKQKISNKKKLL